MNILLDSFGRKINYLRISVTDRCNLRCIYCMPEEEVTSLPQGALLSDTEIVTAVTAAAGIGINKIRLTGGEPLVRAGLPHLIERILNVKGVEEVSLTTNGLLLREHAADLKQAGLTRVNVSLDTLQPERFRSITRIGELKTVLNGIAAARRAGLEPTKINTVVMKNINEDEVLDFTEMTRKEGWYVRFIEFMPFLKTVDFVPSAELKQRITSLGILEPDRTVKGNGPAQYYRLHGAQGTVGFISPHTEPFCHFCNRIRLTADGMLRPCLLADNTIDLKTVLRGGASLSELESLFRKAVAGKPEKHHLTGSFSSQQKMYQIGG